jgi:hypothetical protein
MTWQKPNFVQTAVTHYFIIIIIIIIRKLLNDALIIRDMINLPED